MGRPLLLVGIAAALFTAMTFAAARTDGENLYPPNTWTEQTQASQTTIVQHGDHLWKISEEHLSVVLDRQPTDSDVSPYWRTVIQDNEQNLRSGNPDLIFPGEEVLLPPASTDSP